MPRQRNRPDCCPGYEGGLSAVRSSFKLVVCTIEQHRGKLLIFLMFSLDFFALRDTLLNIYKL
jgi:hypothetical protein